VVLVGLKPDLDDQLACLVLCTVGWVIWPVKIIPEMTYNVSSEMLCIYSLVPIKYSKYLHLRHIYVNVNELIVVVGRHLTTCSRSLLNVIVRWSSRRNASKKHRRSCQRRQLQRYAFAAYITSVIILTGVHSVSEHFSTLFVILSRWILNWYNRHIFTMEVTQYRFWCVNRIRTVSVIEPFGMFFVLLCVSWHWCTGMNL